MGSVGRYRVRSYGECSGRCSALDARLDAHRQSRLGRSCRYCIARSEPMSLRTDRSRYEAAYASRSNQTFAIEPQSVAAKIRDWGQHVLVIAASPEYGSE